MVVPRGCVKCILCRGSVNLKSGDLSRFKIHLETVHDALYDMDLIISVAFLEDGEKDSIVENVFPRIKTFFKAVKSSTDSNDDHKLSIEKRLLEEDEEEEDNEVQRKPLKRIRIEEQKSSDEVELDVIREVLGGNGDLNKSVLEYEISDDDVSDESDNEDDAEEDAEEDTVPLETGLSHCDLCQLSLPNSSFQSHMELHEEETNKDSSVNKTKSEREDIVDYNQSNTEVNSDYSKCEICEKTMMKKSLGKHRRKIHNIYVSKTILEKVSSSRNDFANGEITTEESALESMSTDIQSNKHIAVDNIAAIDPIGDVDDQEDKSDPSFHMNSSMGSSVLRCDVCLKSMLKKSLRRHMIKLHSSDKPEYSTRGNNDSPIDTADAFINNSIVEAPEIDFRCKICFRRFDELPELKNHVKEAHDIEYEDLETIEEEQKKEAREEAIKKLKTEMVLQEGALAGDANLEGCEEYETQVNKYQCEQCDAQFKRRDSLVRHNRNVHANSLTV